RGFASEDALMTAPETRSSAPYRIIRDAMGRALASDGSVIEGLYPAGEGAGYAGGIMSAAADGLHQAERSAMKR
ncbi:MAG: FAD-dependent oxidoreductase, partial [Firmicutes bacterium]|nr:FAD-dependent oxidoreductase [Bacillota bacterium]